MSDRKTYRVLILGGLHNGEHPIHPGVNMPRNGRSSRESYHLYKFVEASDSLIVNLNEQYTRTDYPVDQILTESEQYNQLSCHVFTISTLKELGVDVVNLANNHILSQGPGGLESMFKTLSDLGIDWFGAGKSIDEAREPYRLRLPQRVGGGEIHFHGSLQYSANRHGLYAGADSPGCAPLRISGVPKARSSGSQSENALQVAFPHWGANDAWRTQGQYRLAHRYLQKDYDLILGHGPASLQEVHRKRQRWVVYSIGNGLGTSGGQGRNLADERGVIPFKFWAILEVHLEGASRFIRLKLYPVYLNSSIDKHHSGPVSERDFDRVLKTLVSKPARPWRFDNPANNTGVDDLGHYMVLDLGAWVEGSKPSRLRGEFEGKDPGEWLLRSPDSSIEDRILGLKHDFGSGPVALAAEADGGRVRWLTRALALIDFDSKRMLLHSYRAHESSLGSTIVDDKLLSAELFSEAGIPTPKTFQVNTAEEAARAARVLSGPVVIKPRWGKKSQGVSTGLVTDHEIFEAFSTANGYDAQVIVQQHIEGSEELRVMASPRETVAVLKRVLPHVTGDAVSSINQLIKDKNQQRTLNPSLRRRPIPFDSLTHRELARGGYTLADIPKMGEIVTVRNVAGLSAGADAFQALELATPQMKEAATKAVGAVPGLGWGGVDVIIEKGTGQPYVVEVNTNAAYGAALFPTYGQPRDVAKDVWRLKCAATAPEATAEPQVPEIHLNDSSMIREKEQSPGEESGFEQLFRDSLIRQDYGVEVRSPDVFEITSVGGKKRWATKSGLTAGDGSTVSYAIAQHRLVRELFSIAELPRPRFRRVTSAEQLSTFVEGRVGHVVVGPEAAPWEGHEARLMNESEVLDTRQVPGSMWVQARSPGIRVRILATRHKSWVVTAQVNLRGIGDDYVLTASQLAVRAVRAVPELGWAAVDILLRPARLIEGRVGGVLVEGLTRAQKYTAKDSLVAGDFDAFCRWLVEQHGS